MSDLTERINKALDGKTADRVSLRDGTVVAVQVPAALLREAADEIVSLERHHEIVRNGAMDQIIEADAEIAQLREQLAAKDAELAKWHGHQCVRQLDEAGEGW